MNWTRCCCAPVALFQVPSQAVLRIGLHNFGEAIGKNNVLSRPFLCVCVSVCLSCHPGPIWVFLNHFSTQVTDSSSLYNYFADQTKIKPHLQVPISKRSVVHLLQINAHLRFLHFVSLLRACVCDSSSP